MSRASIHAFAEAATQASGLAAELDVAFHPVSVDRFPDRESRVRVQPSAPTALLFRSLDNPNAKLVELLLAVSALRANGAKRVILIAPYLAYMRQDCEFRPGEAISQSVIGRLLAERFDGLLTVDPHLHRTRALSQVVPGIEVASLSAGPALSSALDASGSPLVVGPDEESRQWVSAIAAPLGLETLIGEKSRAEDQAVTLDFPDVDRCRGRDVVLVDDVISSGETMALAARSLTAAGATSIHVLATHCLARPSGLARLHAAGITQIRASDTVPGPVATIRVMPLVAQEIRRRGWL